MSDTNQNVNFSMVHCSAINRGQLIAVRTERSKESTNGVLLEVRDLVPHSPRQFAKEFSFLLPEKLVEEPQEILPPFFEKRSKSSKDPITGNLVLHRTFRQLTYLPYKRTNRFEVSFFLTEEEASLYYIETISKGD